MGDTYFAGDPFALYARIAGQIAADPDSTVWNGSISFNGAPSAQTRIDGEIIPFGGVNYWQSYIAYVGTPTSVNVITQLRTSAFGYNDINDVGQEPSVLFSGLSLTIDQITNDFERQVRFHPIDYFGTEFGDSFVGTDYDDMLNGRAGNDYLAGGLSNDSLYGSLGNDELRGGSGADSIYGGQGEDRIFGGRGWDTLLGGAGNDRIAGGLGTDYIDGGDGIDLADYTYAATAIGIDLNNSALNNGGEAIGDTLISIGNLYGGQYGDDLRGSVGANLLSGNFGDDFIYGRGGNDVLLGGPGSDYLYGGDGADTFQFIILSQTDYVQDFSFAGGDVLNIRLGASADSFGEVMSFAVQNGNDTVFAFGSGYYLVVANAHIGQFTPQDFFFG